MLFSCVIRNVSFAFCFLCCLECIVFSGSGFQLLDSDQELYKNFPLVISERWQQEVAETVYEAVNSDTDKNEARKRAKNKQQGHEEGEVLTCTQTIIKNPYV